MDDAPATLLELFSLKPRLIATLATKDKLDVRSYSIREAMNDLFQVRLVVLSANQSLDLDKVVGHPASFVLRHYETDTRRYEGVCSHVLQLETVREGVATYELTIVPRLWLLTQSRSYRIFQQDSDLEIACWLLDRGGVPYELRLDASRFKKRKYRVQYAESDYAFFSRLLEDAGIACYFDARGKLVLTDEAAAQKERASIRYNDQVGQIPTTLTVSDLALVQKVTPGTYTIRDHDYRRSPSFLLQGQADIQEDSPEKLLERYHYVPGAFLFRCDQGESTPSADDKGKTRHDPEEGSAIAKRRLDAKRVGARFVTFRTTALDLRVGDVFRVEQHQHEALATPVLVLETQLSGGFDSECNMQCEATFTTRPYRPSLATPRPKVMGVESATVVGPPGEEIHTDEFGRVRVHFHWDRREQWDDSSSCYIHVSQGWAGAGFGAINLPRVGQEVIVDFLGGDPDRPIIVGRVFTKLQPVPYKLPDHKTKSGWRSRSVPGGDGYNEIMFEDKKGSELVSIHAERDMATLVEHDQRLAVRNDRSKVVTRDERTEVGRDRSEQVGRDESIAVAGERARTVGKSERCVVGESRSRSVGRDETVHIGGSRTRTVVADDTLIVGGLVTRIYHDKWSTIRGDLIGTVGHDVHETIRHDRFRSVGHDETFAVGNDLAGSVGGSSRLSIDGDDSAVVAGNSTRSVGQSDELSIGGSQSTEIAGDQSVRVGSQLAVEVGGAASELVAMAKSVVVGGASALVVGGALTEQVAGASREQVGGSKEQRAQQGMELQGGRALLRMQPDGEVLVGCDDLGRRALSLRVEGEGQLRTVTLAFGTSKLVLREDGAIALSGISLSFNGEVLKSGAITPEVYPPVVAPLPAAVTT